MRLVVRLVVRLGVRLVGTRDGSDGRRERVRLGKSDGYGSDGWKRQTGGGGWGSRTGTARTVDGNGYGSDGDGNGYGWGSETARAGRRLATAAREGRKDTCRDKSP